MYRIGLHEQGSEEWVAARLGKLTASNAACIAANGKGLETYCRKLATQRFTGQREETFENEAMRMGREQEPLARMAYELETCASVRQVGFVDFLDFEGYAGASPDGLVDEDGGVELKSRTIAKHAELVLGAEAVESAYVWQARMCMLVLDRMWWDLLSWNRFFRDKSLLIQRIHREEASDEALLRGLKAGKQLVDYNLSIFTKEPNALASIAKNPKHKKTYEEF